MENYNHQNFHTIGNSLNSRLTIHEIANLMSPTSHTRDRVGMSTPARKDLGNSKSPLANLRLKKSKRRECTPAYSPKSYDLDAKGFWTEKKESQRLTFDQIDNIDNLHKPKGSRNFLHLIEDSLNEVTDSYFGHLGSQTTPDTIFKNIFSEEKETKSVNEINDTSSAIESLLSQLNLKNYSVLTNMNTRVIYFDSELTCYEMALPDLLNNLCRMSWDIRNLANTEEIFFLPIKLYLTSSQFDSRLIFEIKNFNLRLSAVEIYLNN
jgi:hypothetical protein